MMILKIFMFIMFLMFLNFSFLMFYFNQGMIMEWLLISTNSMNIEFLLFMDWISMLFISTILLISLFILLYSKIYMELEKFLMRFYYLMMMFILSMILMIISPNIISIMFGWDGLGLISFCLVIFYQNYYSYNSGMITMLMNRLGDIFILISISMMITNGSWNMFMLFKDYKIIMFFLIMACMTKSAQFPFSQWLPLAMAAPTPISALVHSSTLVTAGVYLLIRFNKYLMDSKMNYMLLYIAMITMFMSGLMANFEYDLKKIIALSTLSQLGFMMMILSMGFFMLSFFHLLIHAIFKSLLFMSAGNIIHLLNNNQDIRMLGNLSDYIPFTLMSFQITLFALFGFPFLSGFYSKDLIMEFIYINKINNLMLFMSMISLMFTLIYSMRLMYYMLFMEMKMLSFNLIYENKITMNSMMLLMILSIIKGSMLSWMFFFEFFVFLNFNLKMLTLMVLLMSMFIYLIFFNFSIFNYMMKYFFSSMWFLNSLINLLLMNFLKFSFSFYYNDKVWMEFLSKNFFLYLYFNYKNFLMNFKYKIFMILYMFVFMIMITLYI